VNYDFPHQPSRGTKQQRAVFRVRVRVPRTWLSWRFNGVSVPGATSSSLSIAAASPLNVGAYDVVVSNSAGTQLQQCGESHPAKPANVCRLDIDGPIGTNYNVQSTPASDAAQLDHTLQNLTLPIQTVHLHRLQLTHQTPVNFTASCRSRKGWRAAGVRCTSRLGGESYTEPPSGLSSANSAARATGHFH